LLTMQASRAIGVFDVDVFDVDQTIETCSASSSVDAKYLAGPKRRLEYPQGK
jgi:hypothetical protein